MEKVSIFGVDIDNLSMDETVEIVKEYFKSDKLNIIFTPNTEIVMAAKEDTSIRDIVNSADIVIPDGIGLIYGSRIRKKPLKERVTGFDISIKMLEIANENGYSIYLLGGADGVARDAGQKIKKDYPNVKVVGYHHGFFKGSHRDIKDSEEEAKIVSEINSLNPDMIFVGLGFPGQEKWIYSNKDKISARIIIGNGGVMDILSGNAKRAPEIYQKMGLEWLYRLAKNPSRITRQVALPKFVISILMNKDSVK